MAIWTRKIKLQHWKECWLNILRQKFPATNDLLAENFMDDGSKIWIIDYEYSGQNEPSFEIGNLASESNFTTEQLTLFCDVYWGQQQPEKIAKSNGLVVGCQVWLGTMGFHPGSCIRY